MAVRDRESNQNQDSAAQNGKTIIYTMNMRTKLNKILDTLSYEDSQRIIWPWIKDLLYLITPRWRIDTMFWLGSFEQLYNLETYLLENKFISKRNFLLCFERVIYGKNGPIRFENCEKQTKLCDFKEETALMRIFDELKKAHLVVTRHERSYAHLIENFTVGGRMLFEDSLKVLWSKKKEPEKKTQLLIEYVQAITPKK